MKRILVISAVLLLAVLSATAQTKGNAQEKWLKSAPQSFRAFFSVFKNAVEKNDKNQVASMTRFPFKYGFDAGDEGTMSKSEFLKRFREIFGDSPREFLGKNPPFSRGDASSYVVSTDDASHLIFVKSGNTFKFATYIVEP
jgi:hypothetical protein